MRGTHRAIWLLVPDTVSQSQYTVAGWSSLVAREAHNLEVVGSNPAPATETPVSKLFRPRGFFMRRWRDIHKSVDVSQFSVTTCGARCSRPMWCSQKQRHTPPTPLSHLVPRKCHLSLPKGRDTEPGL